MHTFFIRNRFIKNLLSGHEEHNKRIVLLKIEDYESKTFKW